MKVTANMRRQLVEWTVAVVTVATVGGMGVLVGMKVSARGELAPVSPAVADRPMVVVSVPAPAEDDPGWDCTRQGNLTCSVDGVLMTSIDDMPSDPFGRCVFLLGISGRVDPEGLTYADSVCKPIRAQLG